MASSNLKLAAFSSLLAAAILNGCESTHQERIQKAVKNHLDEQAGDTAAYTPKTFGAIDSIHLNANATDRFQQLADTFRLSAEIYALRSKAEMALTKAKKDSFQQELARKQENMKKRKNLIEEFKQDYEPRLLGYWQPHTFKLGDSVHRKQFRVDTGYNVVGTKPFPKKPDSANMES
jgi:hypothetical protein